MTATWRDDAGSSVAALCFLKTLFARLGRSGIPFAIIHDGDGLASQLDGDIDIAVGEPPDGRFVHELAAACREHGMSVVSKLHYEVPHGYYFIIALQTDETRFLHLDCLCDPSGLGRYPIPSQFLIAGAEIGNGYPRTRPDRRTTYLLVKRAVKGKADSGRLAELRSLLECHGTVVARHLQSLMGIASTDVITAIPSSDDIGAVRQLAVLRSRIDAASRKRVLRQLRSSWLTARRQLGRFLRPTGCFVVVVGPDGCGKSTVTAELLALLDRGFRRTSRFHWRPGLLPKLGRGAGGGDAATAAPPTGESRYRGIVSLIRFLYYATDFVVGYWVRVYPATAQTTLVLGERYFPDVLVNPARYGFAVPRWLRRAVAALVPNPDLTVLLANDPEVIHARKPELSVGEIREQLARLEAELPRWGEHLTVRTDVPPAVVAGQIADRILALCAARTATRLGSGGDGG